MTTLAAKATKPLLWLCRLCLLLSVSMAAVSVVLHIATFFGRTFPWAWACHLVAIGLALPCVFLIGRDQNRADWMWGAPGAVAVSLMSMLYFVALGLYRRHVSAPPDTDLYALLSLRQFSILWLAWFAGLISSYSGVIKNYDSQQPRILTSDP